MESRRNGRPRTICLAVLAGALLASCVWLSTDWIAGSASGLGEREVRVVGWRAASARWDAFAVGVRERSLHVGFVVSSCDYPRNVHARLREARATVRIEVREELPVYSGSGVRSCPAPKTRFLDVRLARPLDGREIRGRPDLVLNAPTAVFGERLGEAFETVPRLIGFGPRDAEHALTLAYLRGRVVRPAGGGPRHVVAQHPGAGRRLRRNGVVRLRLAAD
jgi:hypothetical protein